MTTLTALRSRFPRLTRALAAVALLGGSGGAAAYEHHAQSCCHAGAACCYPGSPCCHGAHGAAPLAGEASGGGLGVSPNAKASSGVERVASK